MVCAAYLWMAVGKFYASGGARRIFATLVLAATTALLVLSYRFVLLPITLLTT